MFEMQMNELVQEKLLDVNDPSPLTIENVEGRSAFFVVCDHAGKKIPKKLEKLGLSEEDLQRHIAWDIGAASVSLKLVEALDVTAILQPYSRLVIDCNRPLNSPESIVETSDRTLIPANRHISKEEILRRQNEIFIPYHACIRDEIDARERRQQKTVLIALHSFTPVFMDQRRPWDVGVLYNRDARLAVLLRTALCAEKGLLVGDNEPYFVSDETDYTIPEYGERRGIPHVEIEIRQDLIADEAGQQAWAQRLARLLPACLEPLERMEH